MALPKKVINNEKLKDWAKSKFTGRDSKGLDIRDKPKFWQQTNPNAHLPGQPQFRATPGWDRAGKIGKKIVQGAGLVGTGMLGKAAVDWATKGSDNVQNVQNIETEKGTDQKEVDKTAPKYTPPSSRPPKKDTSVSGSITQGAKAGGTEKAKKKKTNENHKL